jgi:hypothetical protein
MSVGRGTEIFGENLQKYNVVHQKSHMMWSGIEFVLPLWEARD